MPAGPIAACALAASLYALGGRGRSRRGRAVSYTTGLALVLVVLEPPFDGWADTSFALHMVQHVVLLTVAPPLIVLGRPWPRLWLAFPLRVRRAAARGLARSTTVRRFGGLARRPAVSLGLMTVALAVWHIPSLYSAAVENEGVHLLEHVSFLATSILWWGSLLETPPVRARIDHLRRAAWFAAALVPGWALAVVLGFASTPLYSAYAALPHRAGGLSALADQQVAAGVMWVPGSLAFAIAAAAAFYKWLGPETRAPSRQEELSWT